MGRLAKVKDRVTRYFREVRSEFTKVIWPDRRETGIYTLVVLASVGAVALTIWIVDMILSTVFGWVLLR
ncbi:MAG TPA: preprotein translocase subunit SecE [Bacillota bacterium]|nr:preprotein translocase subunit SecE [Bacillota bacterium]